MSHDQVVASLIVLAYFAGGIMGASILYFIQCRIEDAARAKHRRPRMEVDAMTEHIDEALAIVS